MSTVPFPVQPELTAIAIAYRNTRLISDLVLPRVEVGKAEFKYMKRNMGDGFTVPNTRVGRKSSPNVVETGAVEVPGVCLDYSLLDYVPQSDIENATAGFQPLDVATEYLTQMIALDREVRTAGLVFDANQYAAANKVTLSGTSQWSDFVNSDPLAGLLGYLDASVMRPNIMVIGRQAFTRLRQHPKIVKAVLGNAGDSGAASERQLAELFGLDEVLVGEAFVNTAKPGQTVALGRAWGKHCALLHRDSVAARAGGTTFGFTASFQGLQAYTWFDNKVGARGAHAVKVADSVAEVVCANDLGYFVQNAVA